MYKKAIKLTKDELKSIVRSVLAETKSSSVEYEPMTYDYLFKRHEGLPMEYFVASDITYNPQEDAVCINSNIEEGLIETYPTRKAIAYVCSLLNEIGYPIQPEHFDLSKPNDDGTIYGHIRLKVWLDYLTNTLDDTLKQGFNMCGYQLGTTFNRLDDMGNLCVVYQFEPKFQTNHTNKRMGRYIFHVTTTTAAKKIMRYGLCPSNRNKKKFNYNPRCYFFTVYDKKLFAHYAQESLKQDRNSPSQILTIDREQCQGVTFFTDPNFDNELAIFTYDNIAPSAIIKCEDL